MSEPFIPQIVKLERERNEAREHLAAIKHYLTKERDDALAQIVQAECRAERFCQERDEAREALENHMAATIHTCHDECKRPMCVLRRERDDAREMVKQVCKSQFGTDVTFLPKEDDQ